MGRQGEKKVEVTKNEPKISNTSFFIDFFWRFSVICNVIIQLFHINFMFSKFEKLYWIVLLDIGKF